MAIVGDKRLSFDVEVQQEDPNTGKTVQMKRKEHCQISDHKGLLASFTLHPPSK